MPDSKEMQKGKEIEEQAVYCKPNFKTPIKDILFRSSKVGVLIIGVINNDLTENQRFEMEDLQARSKMMIGLSDKQQEKLEGYKLKISEGGKLTDKQESERLDFEARLVTLKGLTDNQEAQLQKLIAKDGAEPELSQGAKTWIKEVWLEHEKGFREDFSSKYTRKGLQAEEDAINLVSFVDNIMYSKNKKRLIKGHLTGECDINTNFKDLETRVIDDMKCCWSPKTFMASGMTSLYEWQGISYMYLYDADVFRLRYCLVDCPPETLEEEYHKFRYTHELTEKYIMNNDLLEQLKQGSISDEFPEVKKLVDQFNRNFLYEHSGNYTKEERIKTFSIARDPEKEKILLQAIDLALEYYKTITLNMID